MVIGAIERNQALLVEENEQKQETAESRAKEFLCQLGQEITELQRRQSELQLLEHTEDILHLLQVSPGDRMFRAQPRLYN